LVSFAIVAQRRQSTATMGRKLIRRVPIDKDSSTKWAKGHITIVTTQHFLLYSSGYVITSTAYLIHSGTFTKDLLPTAVILIFAVCFHGIRCIREQELIFAGLCVTPLHLRLQLDNPAITSTHREKLLGFIIMPGSAIKVFRPASGYSLDGGYRTGPRFYCRQTFVVSHVSKSKSPLASDRCRHTMYTTACWCRSKPHSNV